MSRVAEETDEGQADRPYFSVSRISLVARKGDTLTYPLPPVHVCLASKQSCETANIQYQSGIGT